MHIKFFAKLHHAVLNAALIHMSVKLERAYNFVGSDIAMYSCRMKITHGLLCAHELACLATTPLEPPLEKVKTKGALKKKAERPEKSTKHDPSYFEYVDFNGP
ncbi:hypothetical protein L6164_002062 [Bauhinia variegata]|uniref:Uncharacterized protein n=1 Tax=Bauhinia variegata TaxID=167791 RepID=A0ACB9PX70_BAUVA|nr:hypothetical protein L6164_002062 [Bauhinia variegata]